MSHRTPEPARSIVRRALTLIETLAATVLLAVLAAAGVGLIREVRLALMAPPCSGVDAVHLGLLADAAIFDPESIGRDRPIDGAGDDVRALRWPGRLLESDRAASPERPGPVDVRVLRAHGRNSKIDRAWVVFECGGVGTARCIPIQRSAGDGPGSGATPGGTAP